LNFCLCHNGRVSEERVCLLDTVRSCIPQHVARAHRSNFFAFAAGILAFRFNSSMGTTVEHQQPFSGTRQAMQVVVVILCSKLSSRELQPMTKGQQRINEISVPQPLKTGYDRNHEIELLCM
jgi:hypothetical protein